MMMPLSPRRLARVLVTASCLVSLAACSDGEPLLTDTDAGPGADAGATDAGREGDAGGRDAGAPDGGSDAGPPCSDVEPTAPSDPATGEWAVGYANPGVGGANSYVSAFAFGADGVVYVGGNFTSAGLQAASNVAAWDATNGWRALGAGLPMPVGALAVSASGALYAAHRADTSGSASRISRWDGTSWTTFAEIDGGVFELQALGETLYVVGDFATIGGASISRVAYHDGTAWRGYAGLVPDAYVATISIATASDVCIGGGFTTLGVIEANKIACWNGTEWSARSLPAVGLPSVNDLERDPADGALVAGGTFRLDESETTGGGVARWTGTEWALIGDGVMRFGPGSSGVVLDLAFVGSTLYVGGQIGAVNASLTTPTEVFNAARWDGTVWHDMGGGLHRDRGLGFGGPVGTVAAGPDGSVYFGGMLTRAGTLGVERVVRWDGTYWQGLRTPGERYHGVGGQVLALASLGTCEVYVGGDFRYAGGIRANAVARYTVEGGYEAVGDGLLGGVHDLAVTRAGRLYAVGDFTDESGIAIRNVAVWDGVDWSGLGEGVPGAPRVIAVDEGTPDVVYVGGEFTEAGGARALNLARWDGTSWSDLGRGMRGYPYEFDPSQFTPSRVSAIVIDPSSGDVIVGGSFSAIGADDTLVETNNVARWDGTRWTAFGDGLGDLNGPVHALAWWDGRLVAAGEFTSSGRDEVLRFAVWTGTDWEPIGTGAPTGTPVALETVGDVLFTAGNIDFDGVKSFVSVFDGTTWSGLGVGPSDSAEALAAIEGGVLAGGVFDRAGGAGAVGIARWAYGE
ncbi:hypothetical protein [Sandaracinus amylolyticus]|uniref:Putative autotransporter protein n=1 Tax=Sandaracinus amylolyticus TaxID=927083 RepID=A0A0F6SDA9_9BACT|nr:hypothetical protein [Sandaracinus amylolyticus]AKF03124.1 putative autotransporter protein [Sandaracinus amylolyticus]